MDEFAMMKSNPQALFDYYMELVQNGQPLDDAQIVKFEYVKRVLLNGNGI
jgi:hypothetical protein